MEEETKQLKIPELASFRCLSLLFILFLLSFCTSPLSQKKPPRERGILFNTYSLKTIHIHPIQKFFFNFFNLPDDEEISRNTFYISVNLSELAKENSQGSFTTRLLVDTGSSDNLYKKFFLKKSEVGFSSPVRTANQNFEQKFEVHRLFVYTDDHSNNLGLHTFLATDMLDFLPVEGILGNQFFSKYIVWFNFETEMRLFLPNEWMKFPVDDMDEISTNTQVKTHWLLPVIIQGKIYQFLFDTGADYTIFSENLAQNFSYLPNKSLSYIEFSGKIYNSKIYISPEICLSARNCSTNVLGLSSSSLNNFFPNSQIQVDGILGMNWIKDYVCFLHYPKKKIFIKKKIFNK